MMQRRRRELLQFPPARASAERVQARIGVTCVLLAAIAVTLILGGTAPAGAAAAPSIRRVQQTQMFTLHTEVAGLYPNATVTATVRVDNPQSEAITVQSAVVTVGDASPSCAALNLVAEPFSGNVTVPGSGTATLPIHIHMAATAPDACQGAAFPLRLAATGVVADGPPPARGASSAASSPLPFTGSAAAIWFAAIALVAIAVGIVLVAIVRRASRRAITD